MVMIFVLFDLVVCELMVEVVCVVGYLWMMLLEEL